MPLSVSFLCSYTYEDDEGIFPECQFVFDLELPLNFQPHIGDGEVQAFYYYPIEKVKATIDYKSVCESLFMLTKATFI